MGIHIRAKGNITGPIRAKMIFLRLIIMSCTWMHTRIMYLKKLKKVEIILKNN